VTKGKKKPAPAARIEAGKTSPGGVRAPSASPAKGASSAPTEARARASSRALRRPFAASEPPATKASSPGTTSSPGTASSPGTTSAAKSSAGVVAASKSESGTLQAPKSTASVEKSRASKPDVSAAAKAPAAKAPAAKAPAAKAPAAKAPTKAPAAKAPAKAPAAKAPKAPAPKTAQSDRGRIAARAPHTVLTPSEGRPPGSPDDPGSPSAAVRKVEVSRGAGRLEAVAEAVPHEEARDDASEPDFAFGDEGGFLPSDFVARDEQPRAQKVAIDFAPEPADEVAHPYSLPPQRSPAAPQRSPRHTEPEDEEPMREAAAERSMEETIELLHRAARAEGDPDARQRAAQAFAEIAERLGGVDAHAATASRLRSSSASSETAGQSQEVDDFGLDRAYEERMQPLVDALYDRWFRVLVRGVANVPNEGRALVVANHGGVLPWDGLMLKTAIARELSGTHLPNHPPRELRWLVEDSLFHAPFLGAIANRLGAIRACPENAERLLRDERLVAVFPEGDKGIAKPFSRRYELQRFGRGGYVKLALRMRAPIVPTAIVGAEEAHPMLFSTNRIAKLFGLKYLPFTATFPWLGPLGLLPLPSRWVILFGEPIDLSHEPASAAEDEVLVSRINDEVRGAVSDLLRKALSLRPQPYFG
jgi:1-acyl-sn-glycerol-3-phosphate acyltransferase